MVKARLLLYLMLAGCFACGIFMFLARDVPLTPVPNQLVDLGPVERGFVTVFGVPSEIIEPDIAHYLEFRTSQLAVFNGKVYASRRVLYRSFSAPRIVIVLALDVTDQEEQLQRVLNERKNYCRRRGYGLYARYMQDFAAENKPAWEALGLAPIRLLRQAMLAFPSSEWFWMLSSQNGVIRDLGVSLEERLAVHDLQTAMVRELELRLNLDTISDIQDERFILTNFASDAVRVSCIVSFDSSQALLSSDSIMVRQSLAARVLLETLVDPVLQEHEPFRRTQDHAGAALTHLARWHPQLMRSIALVRPEWLGTVSCNEPKGEFACLTPRRHTLLRLN